MDIKKSFKKIAIYVYILFLAIIAGATLFSSTYLAKNDVKNSLRQLLKANEITAPEVYVATTGSDSTGTGSIDKPFATLNKAQNYVVPGTIVYVRGGTYNQQVKITKGSGTAETPVTYMPYPGEKVTIDGIGINIAENDALFNLLQVNYVNVIGFEIMNSTGRGLNTYVTNNIILKNNTVHDIKYKGIGGSGENLTIDGNEVYNAAMVNENKSMESLGHSWPQVISTSKKPNDVATKNVSIINNYVHDSWGEGIDAIGLDGGIIAGNKVKDTFSVLIYLDNARNITIDGNYLTATNPAYHRLADGTKPEGPDNPKYPARGIMISAENCCNTNPPYDIENITVSNNLVVNTKSSLRYWKGELNKPYQNMKVYYNTFKDSIKEPAINLDSTTTSGNEMKNNIIFGNTITMPNSSNWTFSNNNWPNGKPSVDNSSSSFSADPLFVNPVPNGPAEGYKLQSNSSLIGKGIPVSITNDYFKSTRGNISTTVGFYEHGSSNESPITPTPTTLIPSNQPTPTSVPTNSPTPKPTLIPTSVLTSTPIPTSTPRPTLIPTNTPVPTATSVPIPSSTPASGGSLVEIYAAGTYCAVRGTNVYPRMKLYINNQNVMTVFSVTGNPNPDVRQFNHYQYLSTSKVLASQVRLIFDNDINRCRSGDVNLVVDKIVIDGVAYQTENPITYAKGAFINNKCRSGNYETEWLFCNGYFQY